MGIFITKRLLNGFVVLLGVVTLIFILFNVLPADPARMVMGQRTDAASLEAVRKDMGLDKPAFVRYLKYVNDLSFLSVHNISNEAHFFYLDQEVYHPYIRLFTLSSTAAVVLKYPYLRRSFQTRDLVFPMVRSAITNTFILAVTAIFLASVIGIALGIISAYRKGKYTDRVLLFISALGMSAPSFFAAIIIGWLFAFVLGGVTGLNLTGNIVEIDDFGRGSYIELKNLVLPSLTLAIRPLSVFLQLTRTSVLDVLSQDYIRTAKSKGLSTFNIIKSHVLRNALNPVVTAVSGWFASLMAGVVFVEYIFGWRGLGYLVVDALNNFDIPLIMGCILSIALMFVIINILVDIIYGLLDPRVRLSK